MTEQRRTVTTRMIAWAGLLGPAAVVLDRSGEAILENPLDPAALVRGLAPALALLVALFISRTSLRPIDRREWALSVYLAVVVVSVMWSVAPMTTLLKAGHLVIAYGLLVVLSRHWPRRSDALNEIAIVVYLVIGATALGAVAAPNSAFAGSRLSAVWPPMHPVTVGMFAMVGTVMLAAGAGPAWLRSRVWLRTGTALMMLAVLLLTRTRSVLLLTPLALLAYLMLQGKGRAVRASVGAALVALAIICLSPVRGEVWVALNRGGGGGQLLTLNDRLPQWSDVLQVVSQRPIHGFGYYAGTRFGPYADRFANRYGSDEAVVLDGTWASTLLELGVLGLIALGLFVAMSFVSISRRDDGPKNYRAAHLAVVSVLAIFSILELTFEQVGYHLIIAGSVALAPWRGDWDGMRTSRRGWRTQPMPSHSGRPWSGRLF